LDLTLDSICDFWHYESTLKDLDSNRME